MNANVVDVYYQQAVLTIRNGGGTFARDAARQTTLPGRYVVALGKPHSHKISDPTYVKVQAALQDLADRNDAWASGRALGTWFDVEENIPTVYVDIVESYSSKRVALQLAKSRGELAIFDRITGESIYLEPEE